jgi:hypothetical protein
MPEANSRLRLVVKSSRRSIYRIVLVPLRNLTVCWTPLRLRNSYQCNPYPKNYKNYEPINDSVSIGLSSLCCPIAGAAPAWWFKNTSHTALGAVVVVVKTELPSTILAGVSVAHWLILAIRE